VATLFISYACRLIASEALLFVWIFSDLHKKEAVEKMN
jgi:hypothetical protein